MSKIALTPNASGTGTLTLAAPNTNTDRTITLPDATGTVIYSDTSGNVGIGTSSPDGKIDIQMSSMDVVAGLGGNYPMWTYRNGSGSWFHAGKSPSADAFVITAGATPVTTEFMRIDSSGNVGIGTSSPGYNVDISSAGDGAASIKSTGTASSSFLRLVGRQSSVNNEWNIISTGNGLAGPQLRFVNGTWTNAASMFIDTSSNLTIGGSTATKASGTTWSNPSDQRLKSNIMDYPKGITELMQVRVREWEYNGKGGTTAGMAGLGVIADEVMTVLPNTVDTYDAKLDEADEETTAIKKFDATEITWLLVKAVQEQQQMIQALQADIAALKGV